MDTRIVLKNALDNGNLISFKILNSSKVEKNVKIVYLNSDDMSNKDFIFETSKGERYNSFENNILIIN